MLVEEEEEEEEDEVLGISDVSMSSPAEAEVEDLDSLLDMGVVEVLASVEEGLLLESMSIVVKEVTVVSSCSKIMGAGRPSTRRSPEELSCRGRGASSAGGWASRLGSVAGLVEVVVGCGCLGRRLGRLVLMFGTGGANCAGEINGG